MSDIIDINGENKPYDLQKDIMEFATEVTNACRAHGNMPPSCMIGALQMISFDLHHNVLAQAHAEAIQQQGAQAALAKINADRIKRSGLN